MGKRRNRQWVKNTNVWLSSEVVGALEELVDSFGPTRTKTAWHLLITLVEPLGNSRWPSNWERKNKYLEEHPKGEKLVRVSLRLFQNLCLALEAKARELGLSRSALIRRGLTIAIDERMEERFPSLEKTLAARGLVRNRWPWEK